MPASIFCTFYSYSLNSLDFVLSEKIEAFILMISVGPFPSLNINLSFDNFQVIDKGDLRDIVRSQSEDHDLSDGLL